MSYDLCNQSTKLCRKFTKEFWAKALELASVYGWRPLGTQLPSICSFDKLNADWDGGYLTNDGQIVTTKDAYAK